MIKEYEAKIIDILLYLLSILFLSRYQNLLSDKIYLYFLLLFLQPSYNTFFFLYGFCRRIRERVGLRLFRL